MREGGGKKGEGGRRSVRTRLLNRTHKKSPLDLGRYLKYSKMILAFYAKNLAFKNRASKR